MGFKQLTPANWTKPDPTSEPFGRVSPLVGPVRATGQDWARSFLAVELKEHVAEDVRELFAVARGAMLYGWFFYPLLRLGEEQLYRVSEAALRSRFSQLRGTKQEPTFEQAVEWLVLRGVIPEADRERWTAARHLRNIASHPKRQAAMPPGAVLRMLEVVAHDINRLFAREPPETRRRSQE